MDRERLKEVHQTDLTESRINQDFVDWLKGEGPKWLLIILVAMCVFIGVQRFKGYKISHRNEAWGAFFEARLPGSYEDVANKYEGVDQLASLSRLQAAEELLRLVQAGIALDLTSPTPPNPDDPESGPAESPLTEELRAQYLTRADGLYQQVIGADDGSMALTLHVVNALNGRAAIAEAREDAEAARQWYEQAAERAEAFFPAQAAIARARAETIAQYATPVTLPSQEDVERSGPRALDKNPLPVEQDLINLIKPDETGG